MNFSLLMVGTHPQWNGSIKLERAQPYSSLGVELHFYRNTVYSSGNTLKSKNIFFRDLQKITYLLEYLLMDDILHGTDLWI